MDNGLGRTGYLLLATVMFALGLIGFGAAYLAYLDGSVRFFQLGLGLALVAMTAMFGFAFYAPWLAAPKRTPTGPTTTTPEPRTEAPVSAPTKTTTGEAIDFEFDDTPPAAPSIDTIDSAPTAPGPSQAPISSAFQERDPAAWPQRRGKSDWSTKIERESQIQDQIDASAERQKLQEKYTQGAPTVRGILTEPPIHLAERAPEGISPGFAAPGMNVGQCGRCKTVVMAPQERPLRLKCPECAKVTLLA